MKSIIGLTERVVLSGERGSKALAARIDTGATRSSIDVGLARDLGSGVYVKHAVVKSAHGQSVRKVVRLRIQLAGRLFNASFSVAERSHMKYKVLIGRNILKKGFLIDTSRSV